MTTQAVEYTYDIALTDAFMELSAEIEGYAKLPAKERAEAIASIPERQKELAHAKVDAHEATLKKVRDEREGREKKFKDAAAATFIKGWEGTPELAKNLLGIARMETSVRALTIQVTIHREDKTTGEGDDAKTIEVITLGSPVVMLGTRVAPKGKPATNGSGGGKSEPLTVDGTEYASASAALKVTMNDERPANRQTIIAKLTKAGHKVS